MQNRWHPLCGRAVCVVVVALAGLAGGRALAMINPNFTPVHLTRQSRSIAEARAQHEQGTDVVRLTALKAVKGRAPEEPLTVRVDDAVLQERLADEVFYEEGSSRQALLFFPEDPPGAAGLISLDGHWFGLRRGDGDYSLAEDTADMKAVWDGRTDMLLACVKYVMADPDPAVPVRVGAAWSGRTRAGRVDGACAGIVAVDAAGQGNPDLFVLAAGGDRLLRYDAGGAAFRDVTSELGLTTASRAAAFGDFNGDGRINLASYDGRALSLLARGADGRFGTVLGRLELPGGCIGLSATDAGVLVSTYAMPLLVTVGADGSLKPRPLAAGEDEFPGAGLRMARPCVVADFDGDAVADVAQPFQEGGLFYKGTGGGVFAAPKPCGRLYTGEGPATACAADFDADGRLDLLITGEGGHYIWQGAGDGTFEGNGHEGEPDYIAADGNSGGAVGDLDNDGRRDFVIIYRRAAPHPFFSRGFGTFGFAREMDLAKGGFFDECTAGQQAGLLADLNGDGGQDLAMVLPDGSVWVVWRAMESGPGLAVSAALAPEARRLGPVTVTGWDGTRCLGAWVVRPGGSGAFFARQVPGPLALRWRFPGGEARQARVIVESGPARVEIGPDGIVRTQGG